MEDVCKEVEEFVQSHFGSLSTRHLYRAAFRRLVKHVPMEFWSDFPTMYRYRWMLPKSVQGHFGVVYNVATTILEKHKLPYVYPEMLRNNVSQPYVISKPIEHLAMWTSYPAVSVMRWSDVVFDGEDNCYLNLQKLNELGIQSLVFLKEYFWRDEQPPADAPLVALSQQMRMTPVDPVTVERIARWSYFTGFKNREEAWVYTNYPKFLKHGISLEKIERIFHTVIGVTELEETPRKHANRTLVEAIDALEEGNIEEFWRLIPYAGRGVFEAKRKPLNEVGKLLHVNLPEPKPSLLPTRAPGMALTDDLG